MSTFTSYLLLTNNMSRTLTRVASSPLVSNAAEYYRENIGKVQTVDDLVDDTRLFTYVMKAAGLEEMTYARAFMKKVLESDLTDADSFANKLTDRRYRDFAAKFNFGTEGRVSTFTDIQSDNQERDLIGLYNSSIVAREQAASQKISTYSTGIDALTNVDEFLADRDLFEFALTAYGLGDVAKYASTAAFRSLLTEDLANPGHPIYDIEDETYRDKIHDFVTAFNFETDGSVSATDGAQTLTQKSATAAGYLQHSGQSSASATLLITTEAYRAAIGDITNVDDFINNSTAYDVALTAFGLNPSKVDEDDVRAALTSDLGDPNSAANTLGLGYQRLAEAFNFQTDGSLNPGDPAQDAADVETVVTRYLANANSVAINEPSAFLTYKFQINRAGYIDDVDDFVSLMRGTSPDPSMAGDVIAKSMRAFTLRAFNLNVESQYTETFLRDVLTSDLSDPGSFANTQADKGWARLAAAFNFQTDGSISGGQVQDDDKVNEMFERFVAEGFAGAPPSQQASFGYRFDMREVTNVDDFLNDEESFSFALVGFGFDHTTASKDYFRQILTSDLNDPGSFANTEADAKGDPRITEFAASFNFATDGSLAPGQPAQSNIELDRMVERFVSRTDTDTGAFNFRLAGEYANVVNNIRSVAEFISDEHNALYTIALSAYGIDPASVTKAEIADVLSSNLSDPTSLANTRGGAFLELAEAFNFQNGGYVPVGVDTQDPTQLNDTINRYLARNNRATRAETTGATSAFTSAINTLESRATANRTKPIDEFLNDPKLYNYVLLAHGFDPATTSKDDVRAALLSDKSRATSFVNLPSNARFKALAESLNFDPDGTIGTPLLAQTASDIRRLTDRYSDSYPEEERPDYFDEDRLTEQEALIEAETNYYTATIANISTASELVADERMVTFILKAFGLEDDGFSTVRDLENALKSDLNDPDSFANQSKNAVFREIAAFFNFDTEGNAKRVPESAVQSNGLIYQTSQDYLLQTLESDAGEENNGVRLALYFKRKANSIFSVYSLFADKALFEVTRTALGMPDEAARADIDVLARDIGRRLDIEDFKDPEKLDQFIRRFIALYDLKNGGGGTTAAGNNAAALISGQTIGMDEGLLSAVQTIRFRQF